ncbi:MAG: hypothetical protein ACRDZR_02905 [Acidimicrobiales bacterium]
MTTDTAFLDDRGLPPGPGEFYRAHSIDELLAGGEPLGSVHDLVVEGLTDKEADAFLAAIGG